MPRARLIPAALALTASVVAQAQEVRQAVHALTRAEGDPQQSLDRLLAIGPAAIPTLADVMMEGAQPAADSDTIAQELLQQVDRKFPLTPDRLLPKSTWIHRDPRAGLSFVTLPGLPGDFRPQQVAAWVLGQIGGDRAARALLAATQQSEWQLRCQAVIELGHLRAIEDLAHALHQPYSGRLAAIELGQLGEAGAAALAEALSRDDPLTTIHAMDGLARVPGIQKVRWLPTVARFLDSDSELEAALATWVLVRSDRLAIPIVLQALADGSAQARWRATGIVGQLGEAGAPAWPLVVEGIADEDATVSAWSIHVAGHAGLGLRDATAALAPLVQVARDESSALRIAAVEAAQRLAARHDALTEPFLAVVERLCREDEDDDVRVRALGALGTFPADDRVLAVFIHTLAEDHPELQAKAALVLGHYGPEAHATVPALIRALQSPHNRLRGAAARALGRIGALEALSALEVVARDPVRPVAEHARLAIERIEALHEDK